MDAHVSSGNAVVGEDSRCVAAITLVKSLPLLFQNVTPPSAKWKALHNALLLALTLLVPVVPAVTIPGLCLSVSRS